MPSASSRSAARIRLPHPVTPSTGETGNVKGTAGRAELRTPGSATALAIEFGGCDASATLLLPGALALDLPALAANTYFSDDQRIAAVDREELVLHARSASQPVAGAGVVARARLHVEAIDRLGPARHRTEPLQVLVVFDLGPDVRFGDACEQPRLEGGEQPFGVGLLRRCRGGDHRSARQQRRHRRRRRADRDADPLDGRAVVGQRVAVVRHTVQPAVQQRRTRRARRRSTRRSTPAVDEPAALRLVLDLRGRRRRVPLGGRDAEGSMHLFG